MPGVFFRRPAHRQGTRYIAPACLVGVERHHESFLPQLAESGFVAFASDLYHGQVADNIADAETLGQALDANHLQAKAEIAEASRFLNERMEIGH